MNAKTPLGTVMVGTYFEGMTLRDEGEPVLLAGRIRGWEDPQMRGSTGDPRMWEEISVDGRWLGARAGRVASIEVGFYPMCKSH